MLQGSVTISLFGLHRVGVVSIADDRCTIREPPLSSPITGYMWVLDASGFLPSLPNPLQNLSLFIVHENRLR